MKQSSKKSGIAPVRVDWKAVGRRLRELRGFDVTQQEFARRVGVSQNHLSTMERGKVEIGAEILLRIGLEFGKSLEWLLTGEDRAKNV
ncbi:MAG: helix-turn-helix transcriptional regulator [Terriglobales bacterium]|jgi:transcriptional regulator with XRE-family HTH domain